MQIDSRIAKTVADISMNLGLPMTLVDSNGEIILPSSEADTVYDEFLEMLEFDNGMATLELANRTYFSLEYGSNKVLYFFLPGISPVVEKYGYLITSLLSEVFKATGRKPSREEVYKQILLDRLDEIQLQEAVGDYHVQMEMDTCVIMMQTRDGSAHRIYDILHKLFLRQKNDVLVPINRYSLVLVVHLEEEEDMDTVVQLINALNETIENEVNVFTCIGVSNIRRGLVSIMDSFREAQDAIHLGLEQKNNKKIFFFNRLLLERFFQEIPWDVRKKFHDLAYSDALRRVMNEEILQTVTEFFANNLNLSEASRKLYIHRNTLIYRMDKIQKVTGLDLRCFDDAVLMKIIIMLSKSLAPGSVVHSEGELV